MPADLIANCPLPTWIERRLTPSQRAVLTETDPAAVIAFLAGEQGAVLQGLYGLAAGYRRLAQLGAAADVPTLRTPYLAKMAFGQVLPEVVLSFSGRRRLLDKVASLPLCDQQRFAENAPVRVLETGGDYREVPSFDLTAQQVEQVIGDGALRSEAEQAQYLSDLRKQVAFSADIPEEEPVRYLRNGIEVVRPVFLSFSRIRAIYEDLRRRRSRPVSS